MQGAFSVSAAAAILAATSALADDAALLRLVPFPKHVEISAGAFRLERPLVVEVPETARHAAEAFLLEEFRRLGLAPPALRLSGGREPVARLMPAGGRCGPPPSLRPEAGGEDYALSVARGGSGWAKQPGWPRSRPGDARASSANRRDGRDSLPGGPRLAEHPLAGLPGRHHPRPEHETSQLQRDLARGGSSSTCSPITYRASSLLQKHPLLGPKTDR